MRCLGCRRHVTNSSGTTAWQAESCVRPRWVIEARVDLLAVLHGRSQSHPRPHCWSTALICSSRISYSTALWTTTLTAPTSVSGRSSSAVDFDVVQVVDVLPCSLLKSSCDVFVPVIANQANLSFHTGTLPLHYKRAQVLPLLKKAGLDKSLPSNYRPISNLLIISKILERLVLARVRPHLLSFVNFSKFWSAYRKGHSTETALLEMLKRCLHCDSPHWSWPICSVWYRLPWDFTATLSDWIRHQWNATVIATIISQRQNAVCQAQATSVVWN